MSSGEGEATQAEPLSLRRVLVAFDGSPHAQRALQSAAGLIAETGGALTVISVVPDVSSWMMSGGMGAPVDIAGMRESAERGARRDLDAAVDALPGGPSVQTIIAHGPPGPAIVEQASSGAHDVVVVGSRGRGSAAALFLGSVSQYVAHASPIPTLIVR